MNQNFRWIKSMGIYTVNEPGFQGAAGPWWGTGAASLLGGSGGQSPPEAPQFIAF